MIDELVVGELYANDEIFRSLKVSNAGGIRLSLLDGAVRRAVVMTSVRDLHGVGENPYHDRLEGDILTYTAAGRVGEQTLGGPNHRLIEQKSFDFPIHGFALTASRRDKGVGPKRWRYLGLLEYLRHYPDTQLDANGKVRKVWLFELRIHRQPQVHPLALDAAIAREVLAAARLRAADGPEDDEIEQGHPEQSEAVAEAEMIRSRLFALEPRNFEVFVKDLLVHCGFLDVCVTRFSADGGVDVNARAGPRSWIFEDALVQVQAKRWLHSVGRKEVAELRGSLQPFAKGAVITTGHFSRAAVGEAGEEGKNPITLIDGFRLSKIVIDEGFSLAG